jgi:Phage integrase family
LVFPHPETGHPLDPSKLARRFKAALRAPGVREVRFHDLRHTFGTRMAAAGAPMRTLQEWLGHRDIQTTMIYSDYQHDDRREAALVERAFSRGPNRGPNLSETERNSEHLSALGERKMELSRSRSVGLQNRWFQVRVLAAPPLGAPGWLRTR